MPTQKPLIAWFRKSPAPLSLLRQGFDDLIEALSAGARNMIGIAIATAATRLSMLPSALTSRSRRVNFPSITQAQSRLSVGRAQFPFTGIDLEVQWTLNP